MDVLQTWIVIGVPGLMLAMVAFVGFSDRRAWIGYVLLAAVVVSFVLIPGDPISAALVAVVLLVLVASGRGHDSGRIREHHKDRKRFTVAEH